MRLPSAKVLEKALKAYVTAVKPVTDKPFSEKVGKFKTLIKVCAAAHGVNSTALHAVITGCYMDGREFNPWRSSSNAEILVNLRKDLLEGKDIHASIEKHFRQPEALRIDESALVLPEFLV